MVITMTNQGGDAGGHSAGPEPGCEGFDHGTELRLSELRCGLLRRYPGALPMIFLPFLVRKLAGYFHGVNMTGSGGAPFFVNVGSQGFVADDTFDAGFFQGLLGG